MPEPVATTTLHCIVENFGIMTQDFRKNSNISHFEISRALNLLVHCHTHSLTLHFTPRRLDHLSSDEFEFQTLLDDLVQGGLEIRGVLILKETLKWIQTKQRSTGF